MANRVFASCLNQEPRLYNLPVFGLILGGGALALGGFALGLMWGMGSGALGFGIGNYLSGQWHAGNVQRKLYRLLPWQRHIIDKNLPESHHRRLM